MAASRVTYILSEKGKQKAVYEGYIYTRDRATSDKIYWRCEDRSCYARMICSGDVVISPPNEHRLHAPSATKVHAAKASEIVKQRAINCESSTRNIVQHALSQVPVSAIPSVTSTASLSQMVRRKRRAQLQDDSDGSGDKNAEEVPQILPRKLQKTLDNQLFYREVPQEGMLLFVSEYGLRLLRDNLHWFGDGTFYVAPAGYTQLYTIHVLLNNHTTVPTVYALLPDKTLETYKSFLQSLASLCPDTNFTPETVTLDFESAAIAAFRHQFPGSTLHGCFFHLSQSIWRRIQEAGLQVRYTDDSDLALAARCLPALAFLHPSDVIHGYDTLVGSQEFPQELDPVVDYFESTYIGNIGRGGRRRRPLIPHDLWSQHQRVIDDLPRTTNSLEAWHAAFKCMVNKAHPSVAALVTKMRQEESAVTRTVERVRAGDTLPRKKKYIKSDTRIREAIETYDSENIIDFLRRIAHNISY